MRKGEIESLTPAEQVRVFRYRICLGYRIASGTSMKLTNSTYLGWRVDDRDKFTEMACDQLIIQNPVLILQALEKGVLAQKRIAGLKLIVCSVALLTE